MRCLRQKGTVEFSTFHAWRWRSKAENGALPETYQGFRNGSLGQFGADCVVGRKSSDISSCNDFEHLDPPE